MTIGGSLDPVTGPSLVLRGIQQFYDGAVGRDDVRRCGGSLAAGRAAFRLIRPDGTSWMIRAVRADGAVHDSYRGTGAATMREWVDSRIATLVRLERDGYPAPRPVRSRSGELVAAVDDWLVSATSYVDGPVVRPTVDQLRLLGESLGRLHTLPDQPGGDRVAQRGAVGPAAERAGGGLAPWRADGGLVGVGRSGWHGDAAIPYALETLAAVEPALPGSWADLHAACQQTIEAIRAHAPRLPEAITHADAWPGNCVQTASDEVTLIDWDTGGRGPALLDLGRCLLECHLDTDLPVDDPARWHIRPDERRIAAVAQGYRRWRAVTAVERELLLAGIRFGVAYVGTLHLADALLHRRRGPAMDARLARLRNRLAVSERVAAIAERHLVR